MYTNQTANKENQTIKDQPKNNQAVLKKIQATINLFHEKPIIAMDLLLK